MKTRFNLICICIVISLLLSTSGAVCLTIQMGISGFKAGYEAAMKGEEFTIPNYQMIYTYPTSNLLEKTGSIINEKDGSELSMKPIIALIDVPTTNQSGVLSFAIKTLMVVTTIALIYCIVQFVKLIKGIHQGIIFDWQNVKRLRKLGWGLIYMFISYYLYMFCTNQILINTIQIKGCDFSSFFLFTEPTLILGFVSLLIAEIFAIGLKMKEEQDLTI